MDVKEILRNYIVQELLDGRKLDLRDQDDLLSQGMLDSLGILQLVYFIEKQFNIQIPQEDVTVRGFRTVASIADYLERFDRIKRR